MLSLRGERLEGTARSRPSQRRRTTVSVGAREMGTRQEERTGALATSVASASEGAAVGDGGAISKPARTGGADGSTGSSTQQGPSPGQPSWPSGQPPGPWGSPQPWPPG